MEIDGTMQSMEGLVDFHEATWVHKYNGKYYLSYSDNHNPGQEGVEGYNRMRYAVSDHPLGPWKYMGIYMGGSRTVSPTMVPSWNTRANGLLSTIR